MASVISNLDSPIAILGLGLSGLAVKKLIESYAPEKKIITYDAKAPGADEKDLASLFSKNTIKTLIVSPGIPLSLPEIQSELKKGVFLTSEISLAYSCLQKEKCIAVTGSIGKSTTVMLLESALKTYDPNCLAVGNIGKPLAEYVLEVKAGQRTQASWLAVELSSYQLENFENLQADHSIITYFTSNHLERYPSLQDYYKTKWRLVEKTTGKVFLNALSPDLIDFSQNHPSKAELVLCRPDDSLFKNLHLKNCQLLGSHNQQNLALVARLLTELKLGPEAFVAIKEFPGLPHRLENLGLTKSGVRFVNDSKATALESVWSAVESLAEQVSNQTHLWLLLGGKDKNLPWSWLSRLQTVKNLRPIYFGECRQVSRAGVKINGPAFATLAEALTYVNQSAHSGDIVLLSPGGTSHDEFKNFEARGQFFRDFFNQCS